MEKDWYHTHSFYSTTEFPDDPTYEFVIALLNRICHKQEFRDALVANSESKFIPNGTTLSVTVDNNFRLCAKKYGYYDYGNHGLCEFDDLSDYEIVPYNFTQAHADAANAYLKEHEPAFYERFMHGDYEVII